MPFQIPECNHRPAGTISTTNLIFAGWAGQKNGANFGETQADSCDIGATGVLSGKIFRQKSVHEPSTGHFFRDEIRQLQPGKPECF